MFNLLIEYEIANAKLFNKCNTSKSTFKPNLISIHLDEKHMRSILIENQKLSPENVLIKDIENIWYLITLTGSHDNGEIYKAKMPNTEAILKDIGNFQKTHGGFTELKLSPTTMEC